MKVSYKNNLATYNNVKNTYVRVNIYCNMFNRSDSVTEKAIKYLMN